MRILTFFFVFIALRGTLSVEDSPYVTRLHLSHELRNLTQSSDYLIMVLYCNMEIDRCEDTLPYYQSAAMMLNGFVRSLFIDCEAVWNIAEERDFFPVCDPSLVKYLPHILFIAPSQEPSGHLIETRYDASLMPHEIVNRAKDLMPSFVTTVDTVEALFAIIEDPLLPSTVILFTDKSESPALYKAIASEFRHRLKFAEVRSNMTSMKKAFNVTTLPTLLYVPYAKINESVVYTREYTIQAIAEFLAPYAHKTKARQPSTKTETKTAQVLPPESKLRFMEPDEQIYENTRVVLIQVHKGAPFPEWNKIKEMVGFIADYFVLDCKDNADAEEFAREELGVKEFPGVRLFAFGSREEKRRVKTVFNKLTKPPEIVREVSNTIKNTAAKVRENDAFNFIGDCLVEFKVPLLLFHDTGDISMSLRVLIQEELIKDYTCVATISNPSNKIKMDFGVKFLPRLVIVQVAGDEVVKEGANSNIVVGYYNDKWQYPIMKTFFENVIVTFTHSDTDLQSLQLLLQQTSRLESVTIPQISSSSFFEQQCSAHQHVICLIAVYNSTKSPKESFKFKDLSFTIKRLQKRYEGKLRAFLIDGGCHDYIYNQFDIKKARGIILYYPITKTYTTIKTGLWYSSLAKFIQSRLQEEYGEGSVADANFIQSRDCRRVKDEL
eukprot:TRINITY_DN210_c0_g2_i7.p1 TRINITY_DN210_c0_g2~~TRINITY_DN210_c0_g2_i7.p1  ORF type:complete len:664 (+),score=58.05 TRINITY_DN210_c0_g2_i7:50-2041(+)